MDMSQGTAPSEPAAPPTWSSTSDPVFSTTIRGGIPPLTVEPRPSTSPNPSAEPAGPAPFASRPGEHLPIDLDLDVLPALTPIVAGPPAPSPIASAPVPAPPSEPAASFQARPADEFMQAFLGAAEPLGDGDGGGDDDLFAMPPPPPPPPWPWIGAIAAVIVVLGLYTFRDSLLGDGGPAVEPNTEAVVEAPPEAKAPEVKPEPPPETKLAEAKAAPPPPTPPAPTDAAFVERLAKAKAAYSDGKLKATAAALADLSKQAPEHPEVLLLTAQVQLEEGKMSESRTTADKCVAVDPNLADCWLTLGVLRQAGKDDAGAVAAYETYLKLAPTGRYARDANSQLARLRR